MQAPLTNRLITTLLSLVLALAIGASAVTASESRVMAIGDIHGELDGLTEILKAAGIADDNLHWAGGTATLVQTGDFLDRGKHVRAVMDLLMRLQKEAEEAGGRMVVLQGNHEQLNLVGELRPEYVTAEISASFAEENSETRRAETHQTWVEWQKQHPMFPERSEEEWNKSFPLGFLEYQEAIGPDGTYGKWLRTLPIAVKIDSTIFLHGGIGPEYLVYSIDKINKLHFEGQAAMDTDREFLTQQGTILPFFSLTEMNQALIARLQERKKNRELSRHEQMMYAKANQNLSRLGRLLDRGSPLWFRGYHSLNDEDLAKLVKKLNNAYDTEHYVVAHTVQPSANIGQRLAGSIFLIDTGMLSTHYGGRPSVLEIRDGKFTAIYPDDSTVLHQVEVGDRMPAVSHPANPAGVLKTIGALVLTAPQGDQEWLDSSGNPLPFQTHEEIIAFLNDALITELVRIPVGVTKPHKATLEREGIKASAAFRVVNQTKERQRLADGSIEMFFKDSFFSEVAAYKLGRMVGIDSIPPAVIRTHKGIEGSLQLWLEETMMEEDRMKNRIQSPDSVRFRRQVNDMDIFDALINNVDRNQGNILWDDNWKLWMIDHTRSFGRDAKVRSPEDVEKCSRGLYEALQALDPKEIKTAMKPFMGSFEITALIKRHKDLLKILDDRIKEHGEDEVIFVHNS
jgi:hypothetical protein